MTSGMSVKDSLCPQYLGRAVGVCCNLSIYLSIYLSTREAAQAAPELRPASAHQPVGPRRHPGDHGRSGLDSSVREVAGQRGPKGGVAEAGQGVGQPKARLGAERSLWSAGWPQSLCRIGPGLDSAVCPAVKPRVAQASASWLSGGCFQRQGAPQAASSLGQPRPNSRAGRAGPASLGLTTAACA